MKKYVLPFLLLCLCSLPASLLAQSEVDHSYKPLTVKLDESGSKYVRFIIWHQFWAKSTQNNPGTANINGEEAENTMDFGLRRSRFLAYAQISPRFLILTHFGINNQTFVNGGAFAPAGTANNVNSGNKKPGLFIHDAWTEYAVIPNTLHIGAGLHYWHGISRSTNASTLNFMTLDAPIFNWPNIELTDQFARQFGIYAKGKLGKLDYRVAVNKPFAFGRPAAEGRAVNRLNDNASFAGYFNYQFLDQESNKLPYMVGSYLGKKTIFNVGAGFYSHPEATASLNNGAEELHNINLFGFDLFYERPLANDKAISLYSVLYSYDFGPNYLRNVGIMNVGQAPDPASALAADLTNNGIGNAQPTIGTGLISYTQFGYLLPKLNNGAQFMPYVTLTYKDFEALQDASTQFDLGLNYFLSGHHAKLTLQYANRPIFAQDGTRDGSAGEIVLQTHIFL